MLRYYPAFMLGVLLMMGVTIALGFSIGDLRAPDPQDAIRTKTLHFLSGVGAALAVVLVECILVTWFVGTGRWCREVAEAYRLDPAFSARAVQAKRGAFFWSLSCMLALVGVVALGAAADPSANVLMKPLGGLAWSQVHLVGALSGVCLVLFSTFPKMRHIHAQRTVISELVAEVQRIRKEKGLDQETTTP